jgi:hypothetical protein
LELLDAIQALDDRIHEAREIRYTDSVRMDPALLQAALGVIRLHAEALLGPASHEALQELEAFFAGAKKVPLTGEVRFNKEHAYERLDRLRDALPAAVARSTPAAPAIDHVEAIAGLVGDAGRTLLGRDLKLDAEKLSHEIAALRLAVIQNLGPPSGELEAALRELDDLVADASPSGTAVVDAGPMFGVLDRLRWALAEASK